MSSTLDNLQWKVKELQEEVKTLKKQKDFLCGCIEVGLKDEDKDIMFDIRKTIEKIK